MFDELALATWSGAGLAWWVTAWRLVRRETRRADAASASDSTPAATAEILSVFKPLPPLGPRGLRPAAAGLESFVAQLDDRSEMLLGIHESDRDQVAPFLEKMGVLYPGARLRPVFRAAPDEFANPKVAWQKFLAPYARGSLWLFSDADIVARPGFLRAAREEFAMQARRGVAMLTFPYVVRGAAPGPALLDALFVNVEFYPGVLFLRDRGPVDFGLGAGMLFRRDDFIQRIDWREPGGALADDFVLGQRLGPVRISRLTLATVPDVATWRGALGHYLRWSKSVAWNRPAGAAARIMVMPVFGWLLFAGLHPRQIEAWAGLFAMMQVDLLFAAALCRRVGNLWSRRDWLASEAWVLWRIAVWFACWLPGPVAWRGQKWHGPRYTADNMLEGIDNGTSANDGLEHPKIGRHA